MTTTVPLAATTVVGAPTVPAFGVVISESPSFGFPASVAGDVVIEDNDDLTEILTIEQILHWIGLRNEASREKLRKKSLGIMDDILSLTEKVV